jgi:hypothetical protein
MIGIELWGVNKGIPMDTSTLNFQEGDRVIHHYGIKGEFLQEALVAKVHKTGNFKIDKSDSQFRQTGWEASDDGTWGQEWVEEWTEVAADFLARHKLEVRATQEANILIQSISNMELDNLEHVASYLEYINRRNNGE